MSFCLFSVHLEESKSETAEDKNKGEIPEENKSENEHEVKEQHNELKEYGEHPDMKDKDLSAPSSTKSTNSTKRRVGKDIVSVDEKVGLFDLM